MTLNLILEHLFIVVASGILAMLIGLPLGILAYTQPKLKGIILHVVDLLQTIPALALLGMIMIILEPGKATVITGITLYSLLPIVRNTCLGFEEVDPGIREAAKGMGMSRAGRLFRVELPLALPTIFTGVRIAVVSAIGTAVFAAFVGGGGLGSIINRGIRIQDMKLILGGTAALMIIAVLMDFLMSRFEKSLRQRGSKRHVWVMPAVVLVLFFLLLPFGIERKSAGELRMYDGTYSEQQVMARMLKLLVEDRTDLTVRIQDQMTDVNNFKSLTSDKPTCDLMLSYDGTLLTTFLHADPADVPPGETVYSYANALARERHDVYLLDKLGFDNTYAIAVPQPIAEEYGIERISDLLEYDDQLTFGAEHEFFTAEGSMKFTPFCEYYGLSFKDVAQVDVSLKYAAVENGNFQVTEVYATDGLNRKVNLKVLEDDKKFFPDYNGAFLVRGDTFERFADTAPELEEVLALLSGQICNEDMVNMTYRVDVEGVSPEQSARDFLVERNLLPD